jgi:hypothetical protein
MEETPVTYTIQEPNPGDEFTITIYGTTNLALPANQTRIRVTYRTQEHGSALFNLKRPLKSKNMRYIALRAKRTTFNEMFLNTALDEPVICCFTDKYGHTSEEFTAILIKNDIATIP